MNIDLSIKRLINNLNGMGCMDERDIFFRTQYFGIFNFYRAFPAICDNNLHAGILLSSLYSFAQKTNYNKFCKTNIELQDECFLSRHEFEQARKKLLDLGVLKMEKKKIPCVIYYEIDYEILINKLSNLSDKIFGEKI